MAVVETSWAAVAVLLPLVAVLVECLPVAALPLVLTAAVVARVVLVVVVAAVSHSTIKPQVMVVRV
jgi:hypothetical protein